MRPVAIALMFAVCALTAACGGGGGGGGTVPGGGAPPPTTVSTSVAAGAAPQTGTFPTLGSGYGGSFAVPATTQGAASIDASLSLSLASAPALQSAARRMPRAVGGTLTPLVYGTLTASAFVEFSATPSFTFVLPSTVTVPAGAATYVAIYDPTNSSAGWQLASGPVTASGPAFTFASTPALFVMQAGVTYAFAFFYSAQPLVTATTQTDPYSCPASDAVYSGVRDGSPNALPRYPYAPMPAASTEGNGSLLAVTYQRSTLLPQAARITASEKSLGTVAVSTLDFAHTGRVMHVLAVDPARSAVIATALRALPGVLDVSPAGGRLYPATVNAPDLTNDPYFSGTSYAYGIPPYDETATLPGQWDMHAIGLDYAFAYSLAGNGSGIVNPNALGSSAVKIAVIDTGEDTNDADLGAKIVYQRCFLTNSNNVQSTSAATNDPSGHGTFVAGIAGAIVGNGLGFAGAGGNAVIYAYRVFPTPDTTCGTAQADLQCAGQPVDVAAAIQDAVAQGVNVINLSLSGGTCVNGVGSHPPVQAAVADALAANVIVVAAAGNSGANTVLAPACITGVIAAGASALADGQPNASGNVAGTPVWPVEYVPSYSNAGSPGAAAGSPGAWGIVAPGGDAVAQDPDLLHWIVNLYTSTPALSFKGSCSAVPVFCVAATGGTSMASPHVAGAAALILAANPVYQSPSAMKQLLCSTADDIGDPREGCGRLDLYKAMATALHDPHLPGYAHATPPPVATMGTVLGDPSPP